MEFRSEIGESSTLRFAEAANQRRAAGKDIISLGLGEPDFEVPRALVDATIAVLARGASGYSSAMGLPALRARLAEKLLRENGIPATPSNILVTPGAKQAMQMGLFAVLEPGDEVVVINPSFVSFIPQVYIAEPRATVRVVDVSRADFALPMDRIAEAMGPRTKVILFNSPNNPAGYVATADEVRQLVDLAVTHDAYLFSDEIYEKLVFPGTTHRSPGSYEDAVTRVFTINGFSKSHAMTGWRLGYLCAPARFGDRLLKLQQHINTNTCTFIQQAMVDAFDADLSYLGSYATTLQRRARRVGEWLTQVPQVSVVAPQAGFFAFVDIGSLGMDSNTFCGRLIEETGVATTPGIAFGAAWDDHVRLSFAVDDAVLDEGMRRLVGFIQRIAPR
ncbi:MAG: hypothetical protein RLZZ63_317 [Gemmatimonadota bacterium]|jgi:aspartate aminotransferase